jgi:hypothetical protein
MRSELEQQVFRILLRKGKDRQRFSSPEARQPVCKKKVTTGLVSTGRRGLPSAPTARCSVQPTGRRTGTVRVVSRSARRLPLTCATSIKVGRTGTQPSGVEVASRDNSHNTMCQCTAR